METVSRAKSGRSSQRPEGLRAEAPPRSAQAGVALRWRGAALRAGGEQPL